MPRGGSRDCWWDFCRVRWDGVGPGGGVQWNGGGSSEFWALLVCRVVGRRAPDGLSWKEEMAESEMNDTETMELFLFLLITGSQLCSCPVACACTCPDSTHWPHVDVEHVTCG